MTHNMKFYKNNYSGELKMNDVKEFEKEKNWLKEYAKENDINALTSEEILKLLEKYTIDGIQEAFNLTEKEFKKIRKQKNISNMKLENAIRNIDTILYYIDDKEKTISDKIRKKIINELINAISNVYPKSNFYKKELSQIDFSREYIQNDINKKGIDIDNRLKELASIINSIDNIVDLLLSQEEKIQLKNDISVNIDGNIYYINVSDEPYILEKKKKRIQNSGAHHNYKKENQTKILHGKLGEKIVKEFEKERLKQYGLEEIIDEVNLVAQIDEKITFDGLGYDLISYNELRERICIEVKTSYGKRDTPFFVSKKELEILKGYSKEFCCKHYFIYYLLIDDNRVTIKIIDCDKLDNIKLEPVLYKVVEAK